MKNDSFKSLLQYDDANDYQPLQKLNLSNDQAIQRATQGFTQINNQNWFRRKRYDTRLQAQHFIRKGEIIAETRTAVFILSRQQANVMTVRPMLSNKLLVH